MSASAEFNTVVLAVAPLAAIVLDVIFGDPKTLPHPVKLIGRMVTGLECALGVKEGESREGMPWKIKGIIAVAFAALLVGFLVDILVAIPVIGAFIGFYLIYAGLALGSLLKEARGVMKLLKSDDLDGARRALGELVSRDTSAMNEDDIRRALAETVSENLNDGFVAPFFWLLIFGPAGMWVYKTVNTLDSMWGYKTPECRDLGWAAARADDVMGFLPARITAFFMFLTGYLMNMSVSDKGEKVIRDAAKTDSPNAGWPMAAAAWLLEAAMGGKAVYFGEVKDKPVLGPEGKLWDNDMISTLIMLTMFSGIIGGIAMYLYSLAMAAI
jgi:adenosylcobinamide-phosphate synthase